MFNRYAMSNKENSSQAFTFDQDEKELTIDALHKAIAICDWDNFLREEYENPKAQISYLYALIEKFENQGEPINQES